MMIKAFIAGLAFPATLLPIIYFILYVSGHHGVHQAPLQFMALFLPIVFGVWNSIYFWIGGKCPIHKRSPRLFIHGATLGVIAACFGVFLLHIPGLLFGFWGNLRYLAFIFVPIIYGLFWRYIIGPLSVHIGLPDADLK